MEAPKKIGRYEVLEELGHGAMGTVYRANDPAMNRVVALKTITPVALASEEEAEFRDRFQREARAAGALSHPGIVAVFDMGEHEGVPYLVMEFIKGRTLADAVDAGERLSLDRVCEIGQKIAEALDYAHQRGVVHRDVKPANILLTSREVHGIERPKITDFGVAKIAEGQTTLTGQIRGTPAFMSPEQFTGAPLDGRADLFSLGVVLYWMATGEQPFPGKSMTSVFYKIVHTDPVPPRKLNPSLPAKIESVILKCLAKDPAERYQNGGELARELGEIRAAIGATGQAKALPRAAPGGDPDATIVDAPAPIVADSRTSSVAVPAGQTAGAKPVQPRSNQLWVAVIAVVAVLAIAAGWFVVRSRRKPVVQQATAPPVAIAPVAPVAPVAPAAPASNADSNPASATPAPAPVPPVETPKPAAAPQPPTPQSAAAVPKTAPAKPATKAPPKTAVVAAAAAPAASADAPPAPVDFDPKTLDPKQNAKLKIDAEHMPPSVGFSIEMNGKLYLDWAASGPKKQQEDDLFVPPGVQEFRVVAKNGAVQKTSNTVSAEFKAKKRSTLRVELRTAGIPGGVPQGLYPDTQIVLTLK